MSQRIPKYLGKSVFTSTLSIRIYPEPEKYALDSVFQNLSISAYQWKRKAEFDKLLSAFANISVGGNRVSVFYTEHLSWAIGMWGGVANSFPHLL